MPDFNSIQSGTWTEISARIQSRERIFLTYITLTATLVGVALTKEDLAFVGVGVGYVALAVALLSRHHDLIIGYLAQYQRFLDEKDPATEKAPCWFDTDIFKGVMNARATRDYAQILFIILGSAPALIIASTKLISPIDTRTIVWYGSLICAIASIVVVWVTKIQRNRLWKK